MSWLQHTTTKPNGPRWNEKDKAYKTHVEDWIDHYKERILQEADLQAITMLPPNARKITIERIVHQMIDEEKVILPSHEIKEIIENIINDSVGYGPLEELLHDQSISEIMVNGPQDIYIERQGKLEKVSTRFKDEKHIRHIIDRIIAPIGRRVDESSPMVDARLPDGSRVNAVIPPISINGPSMTIRKFRDTPFTIDNLIEFGTFSQPMASFLEAAVKAKVNILVSGGTGSGKTTLLNVLSAAIPSGERVVTIEDMAELRFTYDNIVRLEARPSNMEGKGEVSIRQLVKNALRMRPDRIVVGEVRGSEAIDMLQAMNTGHEGSLTTVHANTPKDALGRLEAMVVMSGLPLTVDVIRGYFVSAIHLIVQTERLPDGSRRVVTIAEVSQDEHGIQINDLFRFHKTGQTNKGRIIGEFRATGLKPQVLQRFAYYGVSYSWLGESGEKLE